MVWPLTGVESGTVPPRPALAVKIENAPEARPQAALNEALAALLGAWFFTGWHDVRMRQHEASQARRAAAGRRALRALNGPQASVAAPANHEDRDLVEEQHRQAGPDRGLGVHDGDAGHEMHPLIEA